MIDRYYKVEMRDIVNDESYITNLEADVRNNDASAMYYLACCYDVGFLIGINRSKAVELFKQAMELGHEDSKYIYAQHLIYGEGCDIDIDLGLDYLQDGIDNDNPIAYTILGEFYLSRGEIDKAIKKLTRGMELGNKLAVEFLAMCYTTEKRRNLDEAYRLFKIAGESGCPLACCNLGLMYLNGWYVPKDEELGMKYIRSSADLNCSQALTLLGKYYLSGIHVEKDYQKSLYWLIRGAETGDPKSQFQCASAILAFHDQYKVLVSDSIEWLDKAAHKYNVDAIHLLIRIYETGEFGIPANKDKVKEYNLLLNSMTVKDRFLRRSTNRYF